MLPVKYKDAPDPIDPPEIYPPEKDDYPKVPKDDYPKEPDHYVPKPDDCLLYTSDAADE